jgi:hypothetical protein
MTPDACGGRNTVSVGNAGYALTLRGLSNEERQSAWCQTLVMKECVQ